MASPLMTIEIHLPMTIEIDVCLEGIGGFWVNRVYASSIPDILLLHPEMSITSTKC